MMNRSIKILVTLLVIGIVLFLIFSQIKKWHQERLYAALSNERSACERQLATLNEEIAKMKEALSMKKDEGEYEERLSEIFGVKSEFLSFGDDIGCSDLELQVKTFINYLDKQDYLASYRGKGGGRRLINDVTEKLSRSLPMLSGEMEDLISLIKNVTHLYRELGKERIGIIKNLLKNESDIFETVIAIFYAYIDSGDRCPDKIIEIPSQEVRYQYAGYFLNTLAGRSYLLRRDSKIRVLASYYSVLVLDRANDAMLNSYGIDIRPFLDYSFYEISNQTGLIYRTQYLKKLSALRAKYKK